MPRFPHAAERALTARWCQPGTLLLLVVLAVWALSAASRGAEPEPGSQEAFMKARGLVRHTGRWRTPQEVWLLEQRKNVEAAQREWATSLALKDPAAFEEWAASAPVVVITGQTEAPWGGGSGVRKRDRAAVIASARATFHSEPGLALLTSESAWVRGALREAGLEAE